MASVHEFLDSWISICEHRRGKADVKDLFKRIRNMLPLECTLTINQMNEVEEAIIDEVHDHDVGLMHTRHYRQQRAREFANWINLMHLANQPDLQRRGSA